jgi:hemerythrin superfamily protein
MSAQKVAIASPAEAAPVTGFSDCHASILQGLDGLSGLPALTQAAARARRVAEATLALFDDIVTAHHADEERELFPAVLRSATPGRERDHVLAIEQRLAAEHRTIEALWRELRPAVRRAATGRPSDLDDEAVRVLVKSYGSHARYEEGTFLPLAHEILGRDANHMAALGLSLHLRHAPSPAVAYI